MISLGSIWIDENIILETVIVLVSIAKETQSARVLFDTGS